jgi:hypothetical protein
VAKRYHRAATGGGIVLTELLDGGVLYLEHTLDGAALATYDPDTQGAPDGVLVFRSGLPYIMGLDDLSEAQNSYIMPWVFPFEGTVEAATDENQANLMRLIPSEAGKTNTIVGVQVLSTGLNGGGVSATRFRVADAPRGTTPASSPADLDLAPEAKTTSRLTCSIAMSEGPGYLWCLDGSGYHGNVLVAVFVLIGPAG